MKKIFLMFATTAVAMTSLTGCYESIDTSEGGSLTPAQVAEAPDAFQGFVDGLTSNLVEPQQNGGSTDPNGYDYGYSSMAMMRDAMGSDMVCIGTMNWYGSWYSVSKGARESTVGLTNANRYFWGVPYTYISNCNNVITMGKTDLENRKAGTGIAYAYRAMFYMDLARIYASKPYFMDKQAPTAVILTDETDPNAAVNNPRATNEVMWAQIMSDLDNAEELLKGQNLTVYTPNISMVYGLKARAYLEMQDWSNAEKYAKLAQEGHPMLTEAQYVDKDKGFNEANSSWIYAIQVKQTDHIIQWAQSDASWGSHWNLEMVNAPEAQATGLARPNKIDRHLYESIPYSDFRKQLWVDFKYAYDIRDEQGNIIPEMRQKQIDSLKQYVYKNSEEYATCLYNLGIGCGDNVGGLCMKFRCKAGDEGRHNFYVGFSSDIPIMRSEEMKLIEIEAVARQDEGRGRQMLEEFAKSRDPKFVYGKHNEAYGNTSTSALINEIWWQRRVELWGEGFAMWDLKRLNKGIIRSYKGTNHLNMRRWNNITADSEGRIYPNWLNYYIYPSEGQYNEGLVNNPLPSAPDSDSPEYDFGTGN